MQEEQLILSRREKEIAQQQLARKEAELTRARETLQRMNQEELFNLVCGNLFVCFE